MYKVLKAPVVNTLMRSMAPAFQKELDARGFRMHPAHSSVGTPFLLVFQLYSPDLLLVP